MAEQNGQTMDEFDLIARYFAPLSKGEPGARLLTDDAALLDIPAGETLVATHDVLIEKIHFTGKESPARIARKLLRVNLSDLAAMGARPRAYLVGIAARRATKPEWFKAFAEGLAQDQAAFGLSLIGGDTTAHDGALTLSLTALGTVKTGAALTRSGAQIGDDIYVSGTLGDAGLGLELVTQNVAADRKDYTAHRDFLITRYELPTPRLDLGLALHGIASAAMDISDGLMQDLSHICKTSRVGARVESAKLPLSVAAQAAHASHDTIIAAALSAGDDYELLFTAPVASRNRIAELAASLSLPLTCVGTITQGARIDAYDAAGTPLNLAVKGFRHFA